MMPTVCAREMRLGKFLGCLARVADWSNPFSQPAKYLEHVINEQRTNLAPAF